MYMRSCVNTDHRYCTSRKKDEQGGENQPDADVKKQQRDNRDQKQHKFPRERNIVDVIQNTKNTTSTRPKLMSACTFLENRNRYFGTFILVKMGALSMSDVIPWPDDSLKYEKIKVSTKQVSGIVFHCLTEKLRKYNMHD